MSYLKFFLAGFLVCVLFNSCSVSKRHYRPGYHIVWNTSKTTNSAASTHKPDKTGLVKVSPSLAGEFTIDATKTKLAETKDNTHYPLTNTKANIIKSAKSVKIKKSFGAEEGECDVLVLKNGEELSVKIKEIGSEEIRYVKCDNLTGPVYVVKKSNAFMVKFANGTKEIFTTNNASQNNDPVKSNAKSPNTSNAKMDMLGLTSFLSVFGSLLLPFLPGILLLIGAIVMAIGSLIRINKYPEKYKGKGWGIAAIIIGVIILLLVLLALSLI